MTTKLQGTIAIIKDVIQRIGPATAREIETHPEVVAACRSSKAKARRLIERLNNRGDIYSTGEAQQPKYWVHGPGSTKPEEKWDFDESHNKPQPKFKKLPKHNDPTPLFTTVELAKEFGVTRECLHAALRRDPGAPQKVPVTFLSMRNINYYSGEEVRAWWAARKTKRNTEAD